MKRGNFSFYCERTMRLTVNSQTGILPSESLGEGSAVTPVIDPPATDTDLLFSMCRLNITKSILLVVRGPF